VYIGLKDIRELFSDSQTVLKEFGHSYFLIGWIKPEQTPAPYRTNLLYVCEYGRDTEKYAFAADMNILCLIKEQDDPEKLSEKFPSSVNILFVKHKNPSAAYAKLSEYFNAQCEISLFADALLEILFSESGIQSMIDKAYYAFGNPIFVFDAGFNLIATNREEAQKTKEGMELIENVGFSNKEFEIANSRNHAEIMKSEVPIMSYNQYFGYDQLVCAIDTKKDLGHIVVSAVNRQLNSIDSKLLLILKKCIDQQWKKDEFIRNTKGFNYEFLLRDLLDGKIATVKPFSRRLDCIRNEFSGNMCCLVVETALSSGILNTHHIRIVFENRFPGTKTLMYNGEIIVILNMSEKRIPSKEYTDAISKICKENDLYAGLSNCFRNIVEVSEYYKQALRAVELGILTVDQPCLFIYKDFYLDHIKSVFLQKEPSKTLCHPKMQLLSDYDKKHNSELAYTLYMYLAHERNVAATSAAMHIHRNSLAYRIKKIDSLIGNDYDSYRERQHLILSYELNHTPPHDVNQ
jgi:hypothetical protein